MNRWRKLRRLAWGDRWLLVQAAVLLVYVRLRLPSIDFLPDDQRPPREPSCRAPESEAATAERIATMVGIAANHGPVTVACLHRSITVWWMLRRRRIPCALRIGAANAGGPFTAHAWVEHAGVPLNESINPGDAYSAFPSAVRPVGASQSRPRPVLPRR